MYIVHVFINVKENSIEAFKKATAENAANSIKEEGVARFDVLQQVGKPAGFVLAEAYFTPEDQLKHRETEHFKKWKADTADMIAEPYTFIKYNSVCPEDSLWKR